MRTFLRLILCLICAAHAHAQRFTRVANTVAEMLAGNPSQSHTNIFVAGYASANDGGGGVFTWVQGDATATDGGTVFASAYTGAPAGRLKREYSGPINARWFGAKGNGVTDDTAALQAWLNVATDRFYIPAGSYLISDALLLKHRGMVLSGDGEGSVFIQSGSGKDALSNGTGDSLYNIVVEKVSFTTPTGVNAGTALNWEHVNDSSIRDVYVNSTAGHTNGFLKGVKVHSTAAVGGAYFARLYNLRITTRKNTNAVAVEFTSPTNGYGGSSSAVYGGHFESETGRGIVITNSSQIFVTGVTFDGQLSQCMDVDGPEHCIIGNRFEPGAVYGPQNGLILRTTTRACFVAGNSWDPSSMNNVIVNQGSLNQILDSSSTDLADNNSTALRLKKLALGGMFDPSYALDVFESRTDETTIGRLRGSYTTTNTATAFYVAPSFIPGAYNFADYSAMNVFPELHGTQTNDGTFYALRVAPYVQTSTGTVNRAVGLSATVNHLGSGGIITDAIALQATDPYSGTNFIENAHGLYIAPITSGSVNNYGILSDSAYNRFNGEIDIRGSFFTNTPVAFNVGANYFSTNAAAPVNFSPNWFPPGNTANDFSAVRFSPVYGGSNNSSGVFYGAKFIPFGSHPSGTLSYNVGAYSQPIQTAAGNGTYAMGFWAANPSVSGGGALTNAYGVYIDPITAGTGSNYGLYSKAASNYVEGSMQIAANLRMSGLAANSYLGLDGESKLVVTNAPGAGITLNPTTGRIPQRLSASVLGDTQLTAVSSNQVSQDYRVADDFGPTFVMLKQGRAGPAGSNTNTPISGVPLGIIGFGGWNGTGDVYAQTIRAITTDNWTPATTGYKLDFYTTPTGGSSQALRMTIDQDGRIKVPQLSANNYLGVDGSNYLVVTNAPGAGATINATDGFIPVRGNATTFTNSPLQVTSSQEVVVTNNITERALFGIDSGNQAAFFQTESGGNIYAAFDSNPGGALIGASARNGFGYINAIDTVGVQMGVNSTNSNRQIQFFAGGTAGNTGYLGYTIQANGATPQQAYLTLTNEWFDVILTHSGATNTPGFRIKADNTTILTLAAASGYAGAGTKFLSDDGTYKTASSSGATATSWQAIGSGTDHSYVGATATYEKIAFGTSGPGFTLTNAGTYNLFINLACFDSGSFSQDFWLTNVTDHISYPGSYRSTLIGTTDHGVTLPIILQITTSASSRQFELWGQTHNVTYASAGLRATNTVLNVVRLY